jgi:TolB-like protein/tetratricopeptide (TPR) repeat protein
VKSDTQPGQSQKTSTEKPERERETMNFFAELKRRNVYKVAVTYAVVAWLVVQAASILLPTFEAPGWVMKVIVLLLAAGFVLSLLIAWTFEMTPEGMKRTEDVGPNEKIPQWSRRKFAALILILTMCAAALLGYQVFRAKPAAQSIEVSNLPAKSIAVLPFDSLSSDPDNAFFAEGVQDEILTRLAKVADLKVIARTSTQKFKAAPENLTDVAKQLGVMNILEGSVQKANGQVRVNVQLINGLTNAHLWAEIYDRKLTDIFSVESDIARTIADTLQAKLTGSEKEAITKKPTANPEAYDLYLRGRFFWNKRTSVDLPKSVEYYNQAIAKDPNYALAYSGLADAYVLYPEYGIGAPEQFYPKAKEMALKALSLEPSLGEPHAALGAIYTNFDHDFARAIAEFDRAIELNPNYATAHQWKTTALVALGEFDRAIAGDKQAIALDPLSLIVNADLAFNYLYARRIDDSIAQSRKTLDIDPNFHVVRGYLALGLQFSGKLTEALAEYRKATTDEPYGLSLLAQACARAGLRDEARRILTQLEERSKTQFVSGWSVAVIRISLGDKDGAIAALQIAFDQHAPEILTLKYDPLVDDLRGDPRFEALIQRLFSRTAAAGSLTNPTP